ncbi:hypothetical protein BJX68DRAFT_176492 [Aspergillus pseudodeflectus]|uniref:Uncharacterized protein n=1 Tax=Aspergillus pseudodeflectus TaxID=176178 RepID=A0ABR4KYT1_9EURO
MTYSSEVRRSQKLPSPAASATAEESSSPSPQNPAVPSKLKHTYCTERAVSCSRKYQVPNSWHHHGNGTKIGPVLLQADTNTSPYCDHFDWTAGWIFEKVKPAFLCSQSQPSQSSQIRKSTKTRIRSRRYRRADSRCRRTYRRSSTCGALVSLALGFISITN